MRTLVPGMRLRRGTVTYTWNGRDDQGRFVAQGVYKPRVHLADQHRTIDLPNEMRVDTTAPTITVVSVAPREFSPDGDGRRDRVVVSLLAERAGPRDPARRRAAGGLHPPPARAGDLEWNGQIAGKPVAPGRPTRSGSPPRTAAGNISAPKRAGEVRRALRRARPPRIRAKAGTRFGVRVSRRSAACTGGSARGRDGERPGCSSSARRRGRGGTRSVVSRRPARRPRGWIVGRSGDRRPRPRGRARSRPPGSRC